MSHLHRNPISLIVLKRRNSPFVKIQIAGRPEWGDPHDCRYITAANPAAAVGKPFLLRQVCCFYQNQRRMPFFLQTNFRSHSSCHLPYSARNWDSPDRYVAIPVMKIAFLVLRLSVFLFSCYKPPMFRIRRFPGKRYC